MKELYMLKRRTCIALALAYFAFMCQSVLAKPVVDAAVIAKVCNGGKSVGDAAVGDLNADGIKDTAVFVACDPTGEILQLVVFLGGQKGEYHQLAQTLIESHLRRWDAVEIVGGILVVKQGCAAACNSNWNRSFKFRFSSGGLYLIGEEHASYVLPFKDASDLVDYDTQYGSSINYLTGTAVHWRKSKSEAKQVRRMVRFPPMPSASFEGIDFDRRIKGVHGHINEAFKLELEKKN